MEDEKSKEENDVSFVNINILLSHNILKYITNIMARLLINILSIHVLIST